MNMCGWPAGRLPACVKGILLSLLLTYNMKMSLSEGQQRILYIIAEKPNRSVSTSVIDTAIIQASGLPADEVNTYLGQLEGLGLVTLGIKVSGNCLNTVK